MIKQCGHYITFQEVPNEISLTFSITNCQHNCEGCHSPWLQGDIGDELRIEDIKYYLSKYDNTVTCICLMGKGNDDNKLLMLINSIHNIGLKVCIYSGDDNTEFIDLARKWNSVFKSGHANFLPDYYKYGSYKKDLGGLDHKTTNQIMLKHKSDNTYEDITFLFQMKKE